MNILIVNDDSISAPGIAVLARAACQLGEVTVVAPAHQCSAMSQKLTIHGDMELKKVTDFPAPMKAAWSLAGTPVDCVKVALQHLLTEKPDLVLSGINNGYNAGCDIAYSGTLGAAFEACRAGIPTVALSTAGDDYLCGAEPYLLSVLQELLETPIGPGMVWNVNFPAVKNTQPRGILRDVTPAPMSLYRETYAETLHPDGTVTLACLGTLTPTEQLPEGSDAWAVKHGYIAIGRINALVK